MNQLNIGGWTSEIDIERYNEGMCDCEAGHAPQMPSPAYLSGYSRQYELEQQESNLTENQ